MSWIIRSSQKRGFAHLDECRFAHSCENPLSLEIPLRKAPRPFVKIRRGGGSNPKKRLIPVYNPKSSMALLSVKVKSNLAFRIT